jgi:hypothetical protein
MASRPEPREDDAREFPAYVPDAVCEISIEAVLARIAKMERIASAPAGALFAAQREASRS